MPKYGLPVFEQKENMDTILPRQGKITIRENPYFGILHAVREQKLDAN